MRRLCVFVVLAGCDGGGGSNDLHPPADLIIEDLRPARDLLPPRPSGIGDACLNSSECSGTQVCLGEPEGFTSGYCSQLCGTTDCPADSLCFPIDQNFDMCLRRCNNDNDCGRQDYECLIRHNICIPRNVDDDSFPVGTRDGGACVTPIVMPGQGLAGPFGTNVQVTSMGEHAECQIAVDPTTGRIVIGYNDLYSGGPIGVSSSADGLSWSKLSVPADNLVDTATVKSDPVMAIDSMGNFWVTWIGFDRAGGSDVTNMGTFAARSRDGGLTFPDVFRISPQAEWTTGTFIDKPWIAVSPYDDSVWVTYAKLGYADYQIRLVRSTDHGASWSAPMTITDFGSARSSLTRNLAQIAVGADGKAVVAWIEITSSTRFGDPANKVWIQRLSADGTLSGSNVPVTGGADSPTFDDPSVALSGSNVYVGFVSGTPNGIWDIRVATSLDGGTSFGPSVKVNDDASCATHFHHQIITDPKGDVHAIWYDNRFLFGSVFYAVSPPADAMNPLSFGQNVFVSDAPFEFTTSRRASNWLGDYLGITAVGGALYATWTDPRNMNVSQIYFARTPAPQDGGTD